jgi:hypothetical protein
MYVCTNVCMCVQREREMYTREREREREMYKREPEGARLSRCFTV